MTASRSDSFGTFLESLESSKARHAFEVPDESRLASSLRTHTALSLQLKLLAILRDGNPRPITDLIQESRSELQTFSEALSALSMADLVEVAGKPGEEVVKATPQGMEMASPR